MELETTNTSLRTLNIVMMWLLCVTVMLIALPWENIAPAFAVRVEENHLYLYFALIFEVSNFISQGLIGFFSRRFNRKSAARRVAYMEKTIEMLDFSERALLREFVLQRKSVLNLPMHEPTVNSLIESGVLKVVGVEDEKHKTPMIISKFARPFITYKSIGLTTGKMSDEQIKELMGARPEFAREFKPMPRTYRGSGAIRVAA